MEIPFPALSLAATATTEEATALAATVAAVIGSGRSKKPREGPAEGGSPPVEVSSDWDRRNTSVHL